MTALCSRCGKRWIISILQHIPRSGYICPHCAVRDRLVRAGIIKEGGERD